VKGPSWTVAPSSVFSGVGGRGCSGVVAWLGAGLGMGVSAGGDGEDPGAPGVTHRVAWLVGVGGDKRGLLGSTGRDQYGGCYKRNQRETMTVESPIHSDFLCAQPEIWGGANKPAIRPSSRIPVSHLCTSTAHCMSFGFFQNQWPGYTSLCCRSSSSRDWEPPDSCSFRRSVSSGQNRCQPNSCLGNS